MTLDDHWIDTKEAAEIAGIRRSTVQSLCRKGVLDAVRDENRWRVSWQSVIRYKQELRKVPEYAPDEIKAFYRKHGSLPRAAEAAGMSADTFRTRLIKAGGIPRGKSKNTLISAAIARVYVRLNIDRCPPNCPGWHAEPDCLTADRCLLPEMIESGQC